MRSYLRKVDPEDRTSELLSNLDGEVCRRVTRKGCHDDMALDVALKKIRKLYVVKTIRAAVFREPRLRMRRPEETMEVYVGALEELVDRAFPHIEDEEKRRMLFYFALSGLNRQSTLIRYDSL